MSDQIVHDTPKHVDPSVGRHQIFAAEYFQGPQMEEKTQQFEKDKQTLRGAVTAYLGEKQMDVESDIKESFTEEPYFGGKERIAHIALTVGEETVNFEYKPAAGKEGMFLIPDAEVAVPPSLHHEAGRHHTFSVTALPDQDAANHTIVKADVFGYATPDQTAKLVAFGLKDALPAVEQAA